MNSFIIENEILLICIIAVTGFIIRFLPRLFRPNAIVSDTYFHLYRAQAIRDAGFRLTKTLPRVVLPHENTYPFLYHYLLALFPEKTRMWAERMTGAFFDTISVVMVYLFSSWLIRHISEAQAFAQLPVYVTLCFAFSPALLRIGSGPRAYNGSPRTMGQTLYLAHIFSAFVALETGSIAMAAAGVVTGALLIVTAKFAVQVLVFFGVFFSIFITPMYAGYLALCFFVSMVITGGAAFNVLKGQIRHSVNYVKNVQSIFLYPHVITFRDYLARCLSVPYNFLKLHPAKAIGWFYSENYPVHLLLFVFPQFFAIIFILPDYQNIGTGVQTLIIWSLGGICWFVLTKLRILMFLGEGERYLEYALYPSFFLAIYLLPNYQTVIYIWIGYSLISVIYYNYSYLNQYRKADENYYITDACLNSLAFDRDAVVWPIGSHHFEALYHTKNMILTHGVNIDENVLSFDEFKLSYGNYPYPSEDWREIIKKYDVKFIYTGRTAMAHYYKNILKSDPCFYKSIELIDEAGESVLYRVRDDNKGNNR